MPFAATLLLAALTGAGGAEGTYRCAFTERVSEGIKHSEDFGRFELVIEGASDARKTAVLRQAVSAGDWQARFTLQSEEAGTLWFDIDGSASASHDNGVDSLFLNLEDGALGLYFEWTLPTPPGQPSLVIAEAALMGRCCAGVWPREGRCRG